MSQMRKEGQVGGGGSGWPKATYQRDGDTAPFHSDHPKYWLVTLGRHREPHSAVERSVVLTKASRHFLVKSRVCTSDGPPSTCTFRVVP